MVSLRLLLAIASVTAQVTHADVIVGRITDSQGAPVAQVNMDVFDSSTGTELTLTGDFTGTDGTFALVVPPGTYDIIAYPPAPPATVLVGERIEGVTVAGALDIGTVALESGIILSGQVLRFGGSPAVGADLEGRNLATNQDVVLAEAKTTITGSFTTTIPAGPFRLSIDPGIDLPLSAPTILEFDAQAGTNLGSIQLSEGFYITVRAIEANGTPIAGADVDAVDSVTGDELLTSDDDTNGSGVASFIVPAGLFDLEVCAATSTRLAPQIVRDIAVSGPTDAGTVTLPAGRHLSGTVRDSAGAPIQFVDIDVFEPGTNTKVLTCDDDTDENGQFLTTVPLGTFDVLFEDVRSSCPESVLSTSITISGDTVLNANLTAPGLGCRYCLPGIASSAGRPAWLDASGSASVAQNNVTLIARDLPQNVFGFFLLSSAQGNVAQPGGSSGILCLGGSVGRYNKPSQISSSGQAGVISVALDLTQTPTPLGFISIFPGETWNFQGWYRNQTATGFSNFTTGLTIAFQ